MRDLIIDIQEDIRMEVLSLRDIARKHDVPIEWVHEAWDMLCEQEAEQDLDDSMDGDHASALASCGWGTDEDYVCDNDYFDDVL